MANSFIKLIRSDETLALLIKHPNAFLLLSLASLRAQRTSNHHSGLEIGEALIGDWKAMGMSEQEYRTAKKYLLSNKYFKVTETNRNRKKSTTGTTTAGTRVKLLDSRVYDINSEQSNDCHNDCPTTAQRLPNDEQECKNVKNVKNNNNEEADASVVVFPFLKGLGLSEKEVKSLMAYRTEEGLKHAVAYSKTVPFKDTLVKQLMWAADKMPEIPHEVDVEKNKIIAKEFEHTWHSKDCRIDVCSNAVEIISANGAICYIAIPYEIKGFRDNLQKNLLERKFKQNKENFA